jgi:hypothetical protein
MPEHHDIQNVSSTPPEGVEPKPFEAPRVEDLGHLRDLTLQVTGGGDL